MKNGWQVRKLGDVATLQRGFDLPTRDRVAGKYPLVSSSGIIDTHSEGPVKGPGVVTGRSGSIGNVFFVEEDFWPLNTVLYVKDFHGNDPRFVFHLLRQFDLQRFASGAGVPTLNRNFVHDELVRVPSLPEQQRIVGILDAAFAGIATAKADAEKNLQNARALFESHLQAIFAQRGKGWTEKRLGDIVTRLTNGYVGPTRNIYLESGVPYLLARHVKNNRLTFDGRTFISHAFNRKNKKSMLKAGDVLLVQSGHIGHSAVVTEDHDGHNCHAMIVITPVEEVLTGPFLSFLFNSPGMRQKFEGIRSGSTVPHLTCGAVRELGVALPDLATQQRIVKRLQELDAETQRLAGLYERKLAALAALKKSLLHQAFSGGL